MASLNALGVVTDVATDSRGLIYILDRTEPGIVVTNAQLQPVAHFGRKGSGPGEFREPVSIGVLADGRVAVLDRALARITILAVGASGRSLQLERTVPLNAASEAMCVFRDREVLIFGAREGSRVHVVDLDTGRMRSFAPPDVAVSPMALDLLSSGRIACDSLRDEVLVASRYLPVVEAFRISTGQRMWVDTLSPFRSLRVRDEGGAVSIGGGRSGFSLISSLFSVGEYRVFQTVFESRRDNPTIDTVVTYVYSRRTRAWMPPEFQVPLLFPVGDTAALSVEPAVSLDMQVKLNRLAIGDSVTRGRPRSRGH